MTDSQSVRESKQRPPSERTVEYKLLDSIKELTEALANYKQTQTPYIVPHANWWDVLPFDPKINNGTMDFALYTSDYSSQVRLRTVCMPDRLELSLLVNGQIIWQRSLFFIKDTNE